MKIVCIQNWLLLLLVLVILMYTNYCITFFHYAIFLFVLFFQVPFLFSFFLPSKQNKSTIISIRNITINVKQCNTLSIVFMYFKTLFIINYLPITFYIFTFYNY